MRLGELLSEERIRIPLRARTVRDGFLELKGLIGGTADAEGKAAAGGSEVTSPSGRTRIRLEPSGSPSGDPALVIGVAPHPLGPEDLADRGEVRILVLVVGLGREARQRIEAAFSDSEVEEAILRAGGSAQILSIRRLAELELHLALRVEDIMVPLSYRIYPDTPLGEILDLMVRRRLHAVPVVGEGLQVLGVITAADVLKHGLQARGKASGKPGGFLKGGPSARDIMTRAVMCVGEDERLADAAQAMASRGVAQLPVIREGEIVGFLTREGVLAALFREMENSAEKDESSRAGDA